MSIRHYDLIKSDLEKALKDREEADQRVARYTEEMQGLHKLVTSALVPVQTVR